jgi:DnaJ-class molecular chaperone
MKKNQTNQAQTMTDEKCECASCHGEGEVWFDMNPEEPDSWPGWGECPDCKGTGRKP